jgi:hyperosmotically inducible periplasmic protein
MKTGSHKAALGALAAAALLALAACGDRVENTEMPQPAQANVEINRQGMEGAKDEKEAIGVAHDTNKMGAAPADMAAADPDQRIASDVKSSLQRDPDLASMKIDVHADDGVVTLIGRAPDDAARQRATELARQVNEVKSVQNQLTLG